MQIVCFYDGYRYVPTVDTPDVPHCSAHSEGVSIDTWQSGAPRDFSLALPLSSCQWCIQQLSQGIVFHGPLKKK